MKKNIDRRFVGREEELADFDEILSNPRGERRIKYIWGPGGIGKTWLAYRMLERASAKGVLNLQLIDMYSTSMRHTEGVMNESIRRLQTFEQIDPGIFSEYENVQQSLASARDSSGYSPQGVNVLLRQLEEAFRVCLQTTTRNHVLVLAFDTFEHVRNLPVGRWILDEKGLQMPGLVCVIASRPDPSNLPEYQLSGLSDEDAIKYYYAYTRSPEPEATVKVFLEQLNQKVNGNPLLLGLAIFWRDLDELKTEMLDTPISDFKKKIVWSLRSTEGSGARNLGNIRLDEPLYQTLVCMAYLNRRFNEFFLNKLVENGYIHLRGKTQGEIWQELQKDHLFFVKGRPEGEVQLHDELAGMFKEYLLSDVFDEIEGQPGEKWYRFVTQIVDWYDELFGQNLDDTTSAVYKVEKLGYILQVDAPETRRRPDLNKAKNLLFDYGREHSDILHQLVLDEINDDLLNLFSGEDRYKIVILLAEIAMRINYVERSWELWEKAVSIAQDLGDPSKEIDALVGPNTWQSDPRYCLILLERAKWICEQGYPEKLAEVLYGFGFAYRRLLDLNSAVEYYEKAKDKAVEYQNRDRFRTILNDMGYVYLLMGDYEKADINIRTARQLRVYRLNELYEQKARECTLQGIPPEEFQECKILDDQIKAATLRVGLTYNTLADMRRFAGDIAKAIGYYDAALNFFEQAANPLWIMIALYSRGEAYRRFAMIRYEAGQLESAEEYDHQAYDDIEKSLDICRRYGFVDNIDTANRRMGRLFHDRALRSSDPHQIVGFLNKAREYFTIALQAAESTGDVLEELENLTETAFLADDRLQYFNKYRPHEEIQAERNKLERDIHRLAAALRRHRNDRSQIYQYPVFQYLLEIEWGAFFYARYEYEKALQHYLKGFAGMASDPGYGSARFRQHRSHLLSQIRDLSNPDLEKSWCKAFEDLWQSTLVNWGGETKTLADVHPELLHEIEMHLITSFMYH